MEITVDLSEQEVIMEMQQQIKELQNSTARIPEVADQITNIKEVINPVVDKVDNLELMTVGMQRDLTVVTGAVTKLKARLSKLSKSEQVGEIRSSFQSSLERIERMVVTLSASTKNSSTLNIANLRTTTINKGRR
jgi:hypothetical protein